MRYPVQNFVETVGDILAFVIELWCAAESERVNVINDSVVVPIHIKHLLYLCKYIIYCFLQDNTKLPYLQH